MGENILEGQVKSFKKGQGREMKTMAQPKLFSRPDVISTTYSVAPVDGRSMSEGERLHAHAATDGQSIYLARGHEVVGRIEGDGAKTLLEALREPESPGMVSMNVTNVSPVSGYSKAVIAERTGSQ